MTVGPASSRSAEPDRTVLLVVFLFGAATTALLLLAHFDVFRGSVTATRGQGSGVAATQQRQLAPFRSVELAGSNNVTIRVGGKQSVLVHADSNLLQRVTTVVHAGRLVIGNTPGSFTSKSPMSVEINMPSLSALRLSGSGNVSATGIKTSSLTMSLPGSGVLHAAGSAMRLTVTVAGSRRGAARATRRPGRARGRARLRFPRGYRNRQPERFRSGRRGDHVLRSPGTPDDKRHRQRDDLPGERLVLSSAMLLRSSHKISVVSPGCGRRHAAASSVACHMSHMNAPCVLASHSPIAPGSTNLIL